MRPLDELARGAGRRRGARRRRCPALGSYRVVAASRSNGGTIVSGLPTDDVDDDRGQPDLATRCCSALLGVLAAAVAGTVLVRRQLRPLHEVAETAHAVAALPLASGDIGVTERVPDHLTDERTEVGQVGAALNTLLEPRGDLARGPAPQRAAGPPVRRRRVARAAHAAGHDPRVRRAVPSYAGRPGRPRRRADQGRDRDRPDVRAGARTCSCSPGSTPDGRSSAPEVDLTRLLLESVADARVLAPHHRWQLRAARASP